VFSHKSNGVTVSQAGAPAITGTALRMYAESSGIAGRPGNIQSGLAIANTASSPVTVTFDLTHLDGSSAGLTSSLTIPASGQTTKFLTEIFPDLPNPFQGSVRISTLSSEISVMGLRGRYNERGDFLISATAPETEARDSAGGVLVMPQIAVGGGYTSQITVFSASPGQSSLGSIRFVSQAGEALALPISSSQ
jgi:hypothetical protein